MIQMVTAKKLIEPLLVVVFLLLLHAGLQNAYASEDIEQAVEFWLDDEDDKALPIFAELAADGNEDAALMLGQLEKRTIAFSPFVAAMPRSKRNALLKSPGGLSGVSWIRALKDTNNLAAALHDSYDPHELPKGFGELLELGEIGPATERYFSAGRGGYWELAAKRYFAGDLPEAVQYHAWLAALYRAQNLSSAQRRLLLADFEQALKKNDLQSMLALGGMYEFLTPAAQAALKRNYEVAEILHAFAYNPAAWTDVDKSPASAFAHDILSRSPHMSTLKRTCEEHCPTKVKQCLRSLYYGVGGYEGLAKLQTPLERLVPSKIYFESKRHRADILRASYSNFSSIFESKFKYSKNKFDKSLFSACIADEILGSSSKLNVAN
ncbi:MAG: hypothetical protein Tsb0019_06050 [Roseibium sp.]